MASNQRFQDSSQMLHVIILQMSHPFSGKLNIVASTIFDIAEVIRLCGANISSTIEHVTKFQSLQILPALLYERVYRDFMK